MPSPVGHAIAGLTVHALAARGEGDLLSPRRLSVVVFAALAPDLDLLVYLVDGRNHHQQETHGVGFAVLAALAAGAAFRVFGWAGAGRLGGAFGLAWLSHILLDYLNRDSTPPVGLMALWPWSHEYYKCPWPIFLDVSRTLTWQTLFDNALAAAWETTVLLPVFAAVWRLRWGGLQRG